MSKHAHCVKIFSTYTANIFLPAIALDETTSKQVGIDFTRYTWAETKHAKSKQQASFAKALNTNVDTSVDKLVFLFSLFILKP